MPKRPSKKIRPQEFPDADDFEPIKPLKVRYLDDNTESTVKPDDCISEPYNCTNSQYKEGDVVTCPSKIKVDDNTEHKSGTIISISGKDVMVLDPSGYIHRCKVYEIYLKQP